MSMTKTFAGTLIGEHSFTAALIGNITVTISGQESISYDASCGDTGQELVMTSPPSITVTRSKSSNVDDTWASRDFRVEATTSSTYGSGNTIWWKDFNFSGTSKTAVHDPDWHYSGAFGSWDEVFTQNGTGKTANLHIHIKHINYYPVIEPDEFEHDSTHTYLGAYHTLTYAKTPNITDSSFYSDNGDVPSGWLSSCLYNVLSRPIFNVTASLPYGCNVSTVQGSFSGATASMSSASGTSGGDPYYRLQFGALSNAAGSGTATVTSTRSTSKSASLSKEVRDYSNPLVGVLDVNRCESDGTESDDGTNVHVVFDFEAWCSSDTQMSVTATVELYDDQNVKVASKTRTVYLTSSTADLNEVLLSPQSITVFADEDETVLTYDWQKRSCSAECVLTTDDSTAQTPPEILADQDKMYTVKVIVADDAASTWRSAVIPQAYYTIDTLAGGRGIAFGKPASVDGLLDVDLDLNVDGDLMNAGEQFYPTFITNAHASFTPPVSPCLVLDTGDNGLYRYASSTYTLVHTGSGRSGTAGTSSATSGRDLSVPYLTTDAQGHVTAKGTHTHTVPGSWYGTCNTAAATAAKVVTCSNFVLLAGALIAVRFSYANTAASPTLNVNSTGAKAIYGNASTTAANTSWVAGETVLFVYDGSYWRMVNTVAVNSLRESVSQALGSTYFYQNARLVRTGKVVSLTLNGLKNLNSNNWTNLANLPAGFRPLSDICYDRVTLSGAKLRLYQYSDNNGLLQVYAYDNTGDNNFCETLIWTTP